MTRKIKIYTTNGMPGTIETNVSTLGELKPILRQREVNYEGMKLLIGETKNELSQDEAVLPEGDFKLYLMPAKTKSGLDFDEMEVNLESVFNIVERLERKIDALITKVNSVPSVNSLSASTGFKPEISMEDQREIEEVRRLASGVSSSNEWDD